MSWLLNIPLMFTILILFLRGIAFVLPARASQLSTFAARLIASQVALLICATYGTIASAALRVVGYGGLSQWTVARAFKWTMWYFCGVTFQIGENGRIEGGRRGGFEALETRPAVFIGNHQT